MSLLLFFLFLFSLMDTFVFSVGMDSSESALSHVDVIVLDEVHYLSDISRGTVWEEIVSGCNTHIK